MPGPKIDIEAVQVAMGVVEQGQQKMEAVTKQILAASGTSLIAMKAPAGQVTATAFDELGGSGKALSEELARLHSDLALLIQAAQAGSDEAAAAATAAS